jgi:hypothetical protein
MEPPVRLTVVSPFISTPTPVDTVPVFNAVHVPAPIVIAPEERRYVPTLPLKFSTVPELFMANVQPDPDVVIEETFIKEPVAPPEEGLIVPVLAKVMLLPPKVSASELKK